MPNSFKIMLVGGVMLLIGLFMCFNDLRMKMSAKQATALITKVDQYSQSRDFEVEYLWTDSESLEHSGHFRAPSSWTPPPEMKLPIYYLAGRPETAQTTNSFRLSGLLLLLGGAALAVMGVVYFNSESVVQAHKDIADDEERAEALGRAAKSYRRSRGAMALLRLFLGR